MKKRLNPIGYSVWDPHRQYHRVEFDDGMFYGAENLTRNMVLLNELLHEIHKAASGDYRGFSWQKE